MVPDKAHTRSTAMAQPRAQLDHARIRELQEQGLSQRQMAKELGIAESTLRNTLKAMQKAQQSIPEVDTGTPLHQTSQGSDTDTFPVPQTAESGPDVSLSIHIVQEGTPEGDNERHSHQLSKRSDANASPLPAPKTVASVPEVSFSPPKAYKGIPDVSLSPPLFQEIQASWDELQALLAWWRERQQRVQDADNPERTLERQTYHVEKRFIAAIKRDADLERTTIAEVVNRAFARYFAGRNT